jgi:hypothetical protein
MKNGLFLLIISVCLCVLFFKCKKKTAAAPDIGLEYFPVEEKKWIEYDVDSIAYLQLPTVDTIIKKFRIKEQIDSAFYDNQNRLTYKIYRFKKNYDSIIPYSQMNWILQDVWSMNKTNVTAEVVEENVRYIKLVFPLKKDKAWNGNAQNTLGEWNYECIKYDESFIQGSFSFENYLEVQQKYFPTLIHHQEYREGYVKGIGMIYKEITDIKSQNNIGSIPNIFNRIEEGVIYKMTMVNYGKN